MPHKLYTLRGFAHLYHSLSRFCHVSSFEAKELCFLLNTANIDTHIARAGREPRECSVRVFARRMEKGRERPYRTEVQLYKSMEALENSINPGKITREQKQALLRMRCLMSGIELSFFKSFGMDIADARTVYPLCSFGLIPRESEPGVCLLNDWLSLSPILLAAR